jgi:hypothetical protein
VDAYSKDHLRHGDDPMRAHTNEACIGADGGKGESERWDWEGGRWGGGIKRRIQHLQPVFPHARHTLHKR